MQPTKWGNGPLLRSSDVNWSQERKLHLDAPLPRVLETPYVTLIPPPGRYQCLVGCVTLVVTMQTPRHGRKRGTLCSLASGMPGKGWQRFTNQQLLWRGSRN